ncbi:hypothetical protein BP5796_12897 [Coleophoma crateriformis]|uniref:Uncharacterized protein n=1 Tax=Coleophoma crateriformis TaxID=565419 RepID=A0A3D8Q583_9HELO|nr:hypothetical protein BP5796_12897 [Coleophoma crateriformis]
MSFAYRADLSAGEKSDSTHAVHLDYRIEILSFSQFVTTASFSQNYIPDETDSSAAKSIMMALLAELKLRTDRVLEALMLDFYIAIYLVVYIIFRISSLIFLAILILVNCSICCLLLWQASSPSVYLGYGSRLMGLTTTIKTKIDIMLAILFAERGLFSFSITPLVHLYYALFDPISSASSSLWRAAALFWLSRSNRVRMPPKAGKLHIISWARETVARPGTFQCLASTYSDNAGIG